MSEMMKAIVYEKYGPPEVLHINEVAKPQPKDNEVLVKIHAASVAAGDWRLRKADPFLARLYNGLFAPRKVNILGFETAGKVEAMGSKVRRFKVGDEVYAFNGFLFGGYAEYVALPVDTVKADDGLVALKPKNLSFEQAAAVPCGGITALAFLRKAGLQSGQHIMVYGASGSVGTYAVQYAKSMGVKVTAVCSTGKVDMVKSIGADEVIDYTKEDFNAGSKKYDIVLDAVGKIKQAQCCNVLKESGAFESVRGSASPVLDDLETLTALIEAGKVTPVMDHVYQPEEIVEAHRYVEKEHKKGNVVLSMQAWIEQGK